MEASHPMPLWQAVFTGLFGLMYLLAGYRTMRFTARVASALLFAGLGALAASHVNHWAAAAGIIVGAGIVGFLLGNALYFVTVGLYGAGAGVVLAALIVGAFGHKVGWASGIAGAAAGAVLAIFIERPVGIFATSLIGGALLVTAVQSGLVATGVIADLHEHAHRFAGGYAALIVGSAILGCIVQARTTKNLPPREETAGKDPGRVR